jgi:lysozyme
MKISDEGLALIKRFEGLELTAYRCPAGVLTIGYGSTGPHVKPGMCISEAEADKLLRKDVARFEEGVSHIVGTTTQNRFDALVSFTFNLGLGNLMSSTLLKKHRAGAFGAAADQFLRWDKANGRVLAGLTRRREAEAAMYRGTA